MMSIWWLQLAISLSFAGTWSKKRELLIKHSAWVESTASQLLLLTTTSLCLLDKRERSLIGTYANQILRTSWKAALTRERVMSLCLSLSLQIISISQRVVLSVLLESMILHPERSSQNAEPIQAASLASGSHLTINNLLVQAVMALWSCGTSFCDTCHKLHHCSLLC